MIMVRRNELACRNGWMEDLWAAATADGSDRGAISVERHTSQPMRPASEDEIAAVALAPVGAAPPPVVPEDVVVGQTPVMQAMDDQEADERSTLLGQDTRSAIKRARERYRAKATPPTRPVEWAESDESVEHDRGKDQASGVAEVQIAADGEVLDSDVTESMDAQPEVSVEPASAVEAPASDPGVTLPFNLARAATPITVEDPFDTVPERRSDFELPRARKAPTRPVVAGADDVVDLPRRERTVPMRVVESHQRSSRPAPIRAAAAWAGRFRDQGDHLPGYSPAEPDDAPEVPRASAEPSRTPLPTRYDLALDRALRTRASASPIAPFEGGEVQIDAPARVASDMESGREQRLVDQDDQPVLVGVAGLDDVDADELDMTVQIAPEVPRACRTCRDFRPAEGGSRGWCTNKFAFSHRRMVTRDEIPCQTSLGCWWLPHDDVWLATADITTHSQPTPHFDAWHAEQVAKESHALPPVRRRRRS